MKKEEKSQTEIHEKVLFINRCSKVVKGGRKFSFSALILASDGQGRVGYGFAKANELTDAIRKGGEAAKKNMIEVPREGTTIPHEVTVTKDGVTILLKPASEGAGLIVGSKVRDILEMAKIKDAVGKVLEGNNPINMVKATFAAIAQLKTRDEIKKTREQ